MPDRPTSRSSPTCRRRRDGSARLAGEAVDERDSPRSAGPGGSGRVPLAAEDQGRALPKEVRLATSSFLADGHVAAPGRAHASPRTEGARNPGRERRTEQFPFGWRAAVGMEARQPQRDVEVRVPRSSCGSDHDRLTNARDAGIRRRCYGLIVRSNVILCGVDRDLEIIRVPRNPGPSFSPLG